jgi:hypothetical protein
VYIQHTWKPRPSGEHVTKSNLFFRERVLAKIAAIKAELAAGKGIRRIARDQGAGVGTVLRVKAELAA